MEILCQALSHVKHYGNFLNIRAASGSDRIFVAKKLNVFFIILQKDLHSSMVRALTYFACRDMIHYPGRQMSIIKASTSVAEIALLPIP